MTMKETVEKAYELFSKYRADRPLDVCTDECCMKVEDEGLLASLPVRQIPVDLLRVYNDSAKPDKTRIEEVKHFLPRYLDLISEFNFPTHSTELSFSRLTPFDKSEWTETELEILEIYSKEFFRKCLNTYPIPSFNDRIENIIVMFWRADFQIDKLLEIWEQTDSLESVLHFNELYFQGFNDYTNNKISSAFADNKIGEIMTNWMESENIKVVFKERIEKLILGDFDIDEKTLNELNLLYEIVNTEKKNAL